VCVCGAGERGEYSVGSATGGTQWPPVQSAFACPTLPPFAPTLESPFPPLCPIPILTDMHRGGVQRVYVQAAQWGVGWLG
jgi:hypothetical protein